MRVRIDRRIHADGKVFYAGDVVELSKYPELRSKLREAEESPKKEAMPARDKMVRSAYKTKQQGAVAESSAAGEGG